MDHPDLATKGVPDCVQGVHQVLSVGGGAYPSQMIERAHHYDGADGDVASAEHSHEGGHQVIDGGILQSDDREAVLLSRRWQGSREALVSQDKSGWLRAACCL